MKFRSTVTGWALLLAAAIGHRATAESEFDYGAIDGLFQTGEERDGYLSFGALGRASERYFELKDRMHADHGTYWLIDDRLINQWSDGTQTNDNELNLVFRQEFLRQSPATWSINVWGQFASSLGGNTVGEFQRDLGVLSPLNGGNSGPANSTELLQMAAVEYISPDDRFRGQVGKLAVRTLVNLNRYADGDGEMFFSPMLGNNPVVPYTGLLGVGAFAQYRRENYYVSGLIRAPDGEFGLTLDTWRDDDREYIIEAALTPVIPSLGEGVYRLTWSLDTELYGQPDIETWSFSADQDFGDQIGAFFRYAWADNTFRDFERRLAAGFQVKKPLGFSHDRLGVGYWWGDPTDDELREEQGLEIFYKAQVSRFLEITPDIQFIKDPALSDRSSEVVFGLRLRLFL